jgi:hypothetical protein
MPTASPTTSSFHVVVPVPPGFGLLRQQDVDLIKAGVLYGDKVTVVMHLSTHMVTGLLVGAPTHERAAFLRRCMQPRFIARAGFPLDDGPPGSKHDLGSRLERMVQDFEDLTRSDAIALEVVIEENVYDTVTLEHDEPALQVRVDPGIALYAQKLAELLSASSLNYPLFATSSAVDPLGDTATRGPSVARATQASIASDMLQRLPTFSRASLSEIVSIRRDLQTPLQRYRSAIGELASAAEGDEEVRERAERVWIQSVAPTLVEIHELVRQNSYIRRLADHLIARPDGLLGLAGIAASIAALNSVPQFLTAGLSILLPPMRAAWSKHLTSESLSQHRLYLLYQVDRALKDARRFPKK